MLNARGSYVLFRFLLFILLSLWCAGFVVTQQFPSIINSTILFPLLKFIYSIVCHQQPDKCFQLNGIHLFVCARCTGIYFGAFAVSFISLFVYKKFEIGLKMIVISLLPLLADVILHSTGIYSYNKTAAFITGLFSGSVLFLYILFVLENFLFHSLGLSPGIKVNEPE